MYRPNIIAVSRGFHTRNVNGKKVLNKDYNLKINPNNQNKVLLQTGENGKNYKKIYDSPNSFIKSFIEKQSLFDMIRHDDNLVKPKKKFTHNNRPNNRKGKTKGIKDRQGKTKGKKGKKGKKGTKGKQGTKDKM